MYRHEPNQPTTTARPRRVSGYSHSRRLGVVIAAVLGLSMILADAPDAFAQRRGRSGRACESRLAKAHVGISLSSRARRTAHLAANAAGPAGAPRDSNIYCFLNVLKSATLRTEWLAAMPQSGAHAVREKPVT